MEMKRADYEKWLGSLKVGDEFAYDWGGRWSGVIWKIMHVDRITKTQLISGNDRFSRAKGMQIGSSSWNKIHPVTDSIKKQMHRREVCVKFSNIPMHADKYTTEQLEAVIAILEEKGE